MLTAPRLTDLRPGAVRSVPVHWVLVMMVVVHAGLHTAVLFPDLYALGVDESEFIWNGRVTANAWLNGRLTLPEYAYNPLGTLLYLLLYVPVAQSPDWFMLVLWTSRCLLFVGLWVSMLLTAWQFRTLVPPLVLAGLVFVLPIHQSLTSSEAVFAMLAGLAFWQALRYLETQRVRHVALAGGFLGLAGPGSERWSRCPGPAGGAAARRAPAAAPDPAAVAWPCRARCIGAAASRHHRARRLLGDPRAAGRRVRPQRRQAFVPGV